ncbi:MAG: hypothetical protein ABIG46_02485 [Candidatus Omnitrophota bacterium]|nr:hypothetical protein [Candidatus Omnitrophota bacterium]
MDNWQMGSMIEPVKTLAAQIGQFVGNLLMVVVILIVGWLISKFIKSLVLKLLKTIKLDGISEKVGLKELLGKGGIKYSLSELMAVVCYWLCLLIAMVVAVNALGLTIAADLLNKIVLYIPNIIAAVFIIILGMFTATLLKNIVQTAANNAGLYQSKFLAKLVEVVVIVFTVIMTLEQLSIGGKVIELIISIVLGSMGLALGLAFGLGCKDIAGKFVSDFVDKIKSKQ